MFSKRNIPVVFFVLNFLLQFVNAQDPISSSQENALDGRLSVSFFLKRYLMAQNLKIAKSSVFIFPKLFV